MTKFSRNINGAVFIDEMRLWQSISTTQVPMPRRLSELMRYAGVRFFDEEPGACNFILEPLVAVTAIGGFQVSFDETTPEGQVVINKQACTRDEIFAELTKTTGKTGFYSYLNSGNHSGEQMDKITTQAGHYSKEHAVVVEIVILGYSAAIEGNLMKLRQWFNHIGRLTNTRTLAQCDPPLVVLDQEDLELAKAVRMDASRRLSVESLRSIGKVPPLRGDMGRDLYLQKLADYYERINGLWPNSRALMLSITADLQNWRGCMGDIGDLGQEREYRQILALINDTLFSIFPALFQHSSAYGYEMPEHWPGHTKWEQRRFIDPYKR